MGNNIKTQDVLACTLLTELSCHDTAVSLPRLCKRLGVRQSTLLRCIAYLGEATLGDRKGAGWVYLEQEGERSLLSLTEEGRRVCNSIK